MTALARASPPTRREIFQAWRIYVLTVIRAAMQDQLEQAQTRAKPHSIWTMKKDELLEVARRELDLRPDQAARFTVIELRELIRQARDQARGVNDDPLARMPKGMQRMTHAELVAECGRRNIGLGTRPTRAEMMVAIRAQVEGIQGTYQEWQDEDQDWTTTNDWEMANSAAASRR